MALGVYHKKSMGTGKSARAFVLISEAKNLGVSRVLETLPQEDLSVLEDGNAFLLTCWRVRRASNTV